MFAWLLTIFANFCIKIIQLGLLIATTSNLLFALVIFTFFTFIICFTWFTRISYRIEGGLIIFTLSANYFVISFRIVALIAVLWAWLTLSFVIKSKVIYTFNACFVITRTTKSNLALPFAFKLFFFYKKFKKNSIS